ncbi:MAG: hypothetical protein OHK0012_09880 [Synechococcales cyanobacterium]
MRSVIMSTCQGSLAYPTKIAKEPRRGGIIHPFPKHCLDPWVRPGDPIVSAPQNGLRAETSALHVAYRCIAHSP